LEDRVATEITVPEVGEGVDTIEVVKVLIKPGDQIEVDQPLVELETGKAVVEIPATAAGKVAAVHLQEGDQVKPGQAIASLEGDAVAAAGAAPGQPEPEDKPEKQDVPDKQPAPAPQKRGAPAGRRVPAAPSVRRRARELGIDINEIPGSGSHGRVSREDVERHARQAQPTAAAGPLASPPLPDFSRWGQVRTEKMSAVRRKTAQHLALSWSLVPHVTIHDKADITELEPLRKKYADRAEKQGGKLTMAVMITKVAASALKKFPEMNASVDMEKQSIIYKDYCNVGIAVATPRGLVVPVIRDADRKNMVELAVEISQIAGKAREGKLSTEDMQGGTFTVTNMGRIGGSYFTPIINYPEVGILGMGRYSTESDPHGGPPRTFLPLSLSFDHRLVDGADGAAFLGWIIEALREPMLLSLEG
jgi:pyruvate dehydrogenase E2 component (dihydrolipoamide acetyltransferase)